MKSCPECDFLMEDDELVCGTCTEQLATSGATEEPARVRFDLDAGDTVATVAGASSVGGAATAVLERTTRPAPMPVEVRFRSRDGRRRVGRFAVVGLVVLAAAGSLVVAGARGSGPFAEPLVSWGLVAPPVVVVPDQWSTSESVSGSFRVELPRGAETLDGPFDAADPSRGELAGWSVDLGEDATMIVLATDFGRGPEAMRAADEGAFDDLVGGFANLFGLGDEVVRRPVPVGDGLAIDAVYVDDDASTTRARFHQGNGRFHLLVTAGPDAGADALDRAHQRLLEGFDFVR